MILTLRGRKSSEEERENGKTGENPVMKKERGNGKTGKREGVAWFRLVEKLREEQGKGKGKVQMNSYEEGRDDWVGGEENKWGKWKGNSAFLYPFPRKTNSNSKTNLGHF